MTKQTTPERPAGFEDLHLVWDENLRGWRTPTRDHWETIPFRTLVDRAVDCARSIIESGAAMDDELTDLLPVAQEALRLPGMTVMTEEQIEALARVAALGVEYMDTNRYADDEDYPEDAAVARALTGMDENWFIHSLTDNFDRRWQD